MENVRLRQGCISEATIIAEAKIVAKGNKEVEKFYIELLKNVYWGTPKKGVRR